MFKKSILSLILVSTFAIGEINVGPAINNLNSRVTVLENKTLTTEDILALGFFTNELDKTALNLIGDMTKLTTHETNSVVGAITEVDGKATYPFRLYGGATTNNWIEFSGSNLLIFINSSYSSQISTTNDLNNLYTTIFNLIMDDRAKNVVPTSSFMSARSNSVYSASSGEGGIVFSQPEGYSDKESIIILHLYKGSGSVSWFSGITWIYGEPPAFEIPEKTYVFKFESLDGVNWKGYAEYVY